MNPSERNNPFSGEALVDEMPQTRLSKMVDFVVRRLVSVKRSGQEPGEYPKFISREPVDTESVDDI